MKSQKKVLKKYPNAKLYCAPDGYFIGYTTSEGELVNLLAEFFLPNSFSEENAWNDALVSVKMTQNFNRTHPLKVDMYSGLEKQDRIEKRKLNGKINKEKSPDTYIYY